MSSTIISGPVLSRVAAIRPDIFDAYDIVHFLCPYVSKIFAPLIRDHIACVTSHHHTSDWELQKHNVDGDAIVVASEQWHDELVRRGVSPARIVRLPYGVDSITFAPPTSPQRRTQRDRLGFASDQIVVGFFAKESSNERNRKGTDVFVAAVEMLNAQLPTLGILVIGPGWADFVRQLRRAGVRVVWVPYVFPDHIAPFYRALDFYWVTARVEGGPVPLLEAMSTGLACVSTPVGLARDLIRDGVNGVLVPFGDAAAVAAHTLSLASDPSGRSRMGNEARNTMESKMDSSVVAREVHHVYRVALQQFALRTGRDVDARLSQLDSAAANRTTAENTSDQGSQLGGALAREITMLELLAWGEALWLQKQRRLAIGTMLSAWRRAPFSSVPPRYLLRTLLPPRFVNLLLGVVRAAERPGSGATTGRALP